MGPDVRNASRDRDPATDEVLHPLVVMIEQGQQIRPGELVELGRRHARIRTRQSFRNGDTLVLTVSVPESRTEKTQAMFRVSTRVRRKSEDGGHDYVVHFATDNENLDAAGKLYARFHSRGILEV